MKLLKTFTYSSAYISIYQSADNMIYDAWISSGTRRYIQPYNYSNKQYKKYYSAKIVYQELTTIGWIETKGVWVDPSGALRSTT